MGKDGRRVLGALGRVLMMAIAGKIAFSNAVRPMINYFHQEGTLQTPYQVEEKVQKKEDGDHDYAVIVEGHAMIESKYDANVEAINEAYSTLKSRGYSDENIMILSNNIPKGRNTGLGITAHATKENVSRVLDYVSENVGNRGSILFYYTGHGGITDKKGEILLEDSNLNEEEFYSHFGNNKSKKILIFDACKSGKFLDRAKQLDGEVGVMSLTSADKLGITSEVQDDFWRDVGRGTNMGVAWTSAMEYGNKKPITKLAKAISLGKGSNDYIIYNPHNLDIPHPNQKEELRFYDPQSQKDTDNLESKVVTPIIFAAIFLAVAVTLGVSITGNVVSEETGKYGLGVFLVFFIVVMFILDKVGRRR